jgi:hypothetical protein
LLGTKGYVVVVVVVVGDLFIITPEIKNCFWEKKNYPCTCQYQFTGDLQIELNF